MTQRRLVARFVQCILHCELSISNGSSLAQVTNMARQMVINYGFSDIGPWSLLDQNAQSQDMIMRMMARNSTSESLQRRIDEAVKKIADEAYTLALKHVRYERLPCCACAYHCVPLVASTGPDV